MTRVILYNIQYCAGLKGSFWEYFKFWNLFRSPKYLDYVIANELKKYNPDIVGLVEVDTGSLRSRKKDETSYFMDFFGFSDKAEKVKYTKKGLSSIMKVLPITRKQANAVISKREIEDVKYHYLSKGTKRVIIDVKFKRPKPFRILLVHLSLGKQSRKRQIKELIDIVNGIDDPFILMGDLNIFDGLKEIRELIRKTRLNYYHGLQRGYTQPTNKPTRALDLILASQDIDVKNYKILDLEYSDHLPVMIDFEIK